MDTVTQLTEWPTVLLGSFEAGVPRAAGRGAGDGDARSPEVFCGRGLRTGKLAPHFLAVLNTEVDAAGEALIRHGNERVLRARFNDARFFWEFDQRVALTDRVGLLEKVTFQKDLGSYAAKSERVRAVARSTGGGAWRRAGWRWTCRRWTRRRGWRRRI